MKVDKKFRTTTELAEKIKNFADSQGTSFSQCVELACYHFLDEKPQPTKQLASIKESKSEIINLQFNLDSKTFKKLQKITQQKNSTLSQEIRYRLSATLENPMFSDQEFSVFIDEANRLAMLGNLLKLAINNGKVIDKNQINELHKSLETFRESWLDVLVYIKKRKL